MRKLRPSGVKEVAQVILLEMVELGFEARCLSVSEWMPFNWRGLNDNRMSQGQHTQAELS